MSLFHKHSWKIVSTYYTPPALNFEAKGVSQELAEQVLNGTTHIYQRCEECGDIKQKDFTGHFNSDI